MPFAICNLSIVPVRCEPSHRSEMGTQVLFGEHFEVSEIQSGWARIILAFDRYEGWIPVSNYADLDAEDFKLLNKQEICISYDLVQIAVHDKTIISLVLGSSLPFYKDKKCRIGELEFDFDGNVKYPERLSSSNTLIENAYMYLNAPYLWGGRSPFGIDCSGFTQMVFKLSGIKLRRDAWMQSEQGQLIHLLDESRPGDLAFFDNEEGKIIHTGILIGKNKIIHSSGKVRIDRIDHHGIYNEEQKKYTHNLRLIKRLG